MLEKVLQHHSLGDKRQITYILNLLRGGTSLPIADLQFGFFPTGAIDLLCWLGIVATESNRIRLIKDIDNQNFLQLFRLLFLKLKSEKKLHYFLNENNIYYDNNEKILLVKNNRIPLRFSAIRNLLLDFGLFIRDYIDTNQYTIDSNFLVWFREEAIPAIEKSHLQDNSLVDLMALQKNQVILGKSAEKFVLEYEKNARKGHSKVDRIKIISEQDTGAGYDICSYISDDSLMLDKFIEVKSYVERPSFYWSVNEINFAKQKKERYFLYLVDRNQINNIGYKPTMIVNPFYNIFSNPLWNSKCDGYYFEKHKAR